MVKIYADGADLQKIIEMNNDKSIEGFTTNPTLMRKAGINNYENYIIRQDTTVRRDR